MWNRYKVLQWPFESPGEGQWVKLEKIKVVTVVVSLGRGWARRDGARSLAKENARPHPLGRK